jgi:hypothetical protein
MPPAHSKRSKCDIWIHPAKIEANGSNGHTAVPPRNVVIALAFVLAAKAVAAMGIPLRDKVMVLAFMATAAAAGALTFRGGGVQVCDIIASLGESWV